MIHWNLANSARIALILHQISRHSKRKTGGYEEFCQKHLCEEEKVAYVRKIAQATNKTEAQIINSAVSNEAGFLTAFNKWKADQQNVEKRAKHKGGAPLPAQTNPSESLVASA